MYGWNNLVLEPGEYATANKFGGTGWSYILLGERGRRYSAAYWNWWTGWLNLLLVRPWRRCASRTYNWLRSRVLLPTQTTDAKVTTLC